MDRNLWPLLSYTSVMRRRGLYFKDGTARQQRGASRRDVLAVLPLTGVAAVLGPVVARSDDRAESSDEGAPPSSFPRQAEDEVEEIVRVSHFDVDRVRTMITVRPALARASWDWGFGDWESALGAASHMGRRDIAELLMVHGARPNLFTAAMMGWLELVQATVAARPGIQRETGPHGITLLEHARAGGGHASRVVEWLDRLGDADPQPRAGLPETEAYLGVYRYGDGPDESLHVKLDGKQRLTIRRPGQTSRILVPAGGHSFSPAGVPSVVIDFEAATDSARALSIRDGQLDVRAARSDGG